MDFTLPKESPKFVESPEKAPDTERVEKGRSEIINHSHGFSFNSQFETEERGNTEDGLPETEPCNDE